MTMAALPSIASDVVMPAAAWSRRHQCCAAAAAAALLLCLVALGSVGLRNAGLIKGPSDVLNPLWAASGAILQDRCEPTSECPAYFRYIAQDFAPWFERGGIALGDVEAAGKHASFRFQILGGELYVQNFEGCYQTRCPWTVWGLLMLLENYPGQVPDVDGMFSADDHPIVNRTTSSGLATPRADVLTPPPLPIMFQFSNDAEHLAFPWPDWSFWGWPEVHIEAWPKQAASIYEGGRRAGLWAARKPWAYWKGNKYVGDGHNAGLRQNLVNCNDGNGPAAQYIEAHDTDWHSESTKHFRRTRLADHCHHRYNVYAEGFAWSVSLKYILGCGGTALLIDPYFHDFFSRALTPYTHFVPVPRADLCPSLQKAVLWGNQNVKLAAEIAAAGQVFTQHDLAMHHVYEYMLHSLLTYAGLQKFTPARAVGAQLVTRKSLLSTLSAKQRKFIGPAPSSAANCPLCRLPKVDEVKATIDGLTS
eukprot:SM000077S21529  [mRNA]  locus=s77:51271:53696:+ [translate_table: standard]